MTPQERAKEFVETGFQSLGVPSLEPYTAIIAELIESAVSDERERCAGAAADWFTAAPRYRTKERLLQMIQRPDQRPADAGADNMTDQCG